MVVQSSKSKSGKSPHGVSNRLPKLVNDYLGYHDVEGHTEPTIEHYRRELGLFVRWLEKEGHSLLAGDLNSLDILRHLADLKDRGRKPKTLDTRLRAIRAWCHWMIEWDEIEDDPCARIKAPKVPQMAKPFISKSDFQGVLDICPLNTLLGARRKAMLLLLITTGLRHRELCLLELADLDWERGLVHVRHGKGQKERYIAFVKPCQRVMARYIRHRQDSLPCLWVTEEGTPLSYVGIGKDLKRLYARAGVEVKDPCHVYRRSFAAESIRLGIPTPLIRKRAGWTSDQMIEKYTRWMEEEEEEATRAYKDFMPFGGGLNI